MLPSFSIMEGKIVNVYQMVTERIIEELKNGTIPWKKPWINVQLQTGAYNRITKKPYSLLNQMLLGKEGEYATYKQWTSLGGKLKRKARSEIIVFWKIQEIQEEKDNGEIEKKQIPILRYYRVFHISQIEGVKPLPKMTLPEIKGIEAGDRLIRDYAKREAIEIKEKISNDAYYNPQREQIILPMKGQFTEINEFYSTAFHELVHSTGHPNRLNRDFERIKSFGSNLYSYEELVAETGAAMLMNILKLETVSSFKNSTAYIKNWIQKLQENEKMIVISAAKAEKAVRYILNGQD